MDKKIRFALIGCGNIGNRHAALVATCGVLVAVCDIDGPKAAALGNAYGAAVYYAVDALLAGEKNLDVLVVCTPNGLHAAHSIAAMEAGLHVVCEKPMAISSLDCKNMLAASRQYNKHLFVVKQNRYNPAVTAVKAALDAGALGKVLSFQLSCFWNRNKEYYNNPWRGTRHLDGGTLFTQFSHFIDILYWLLGDVKSTRAYLQNSLHRNIIQFEDSGAVIFQLQSGAIGTLNYSVDAYGQNMEGSLTLLGEKGTVKIGGQYLNTVEYQCIEQYTIAQPAAQAGANDYGSYQGSMSNHDKVYDNVMAVLQGKQAMHTNAIDALKTVEIIEKIYRANALAE